MSRPTRVIVDTASGYYDIDYLSRIAIWHDMDREAAGEHMEPEPFLFDSVEIEVGEAMLFDAAGVPRATDRVIGVTPVVAAVPA